MTKCEGGAMRVITDRVQVQKNGPEYVRIQYGIVIVYASILRRSSGGSVQGPLPRHNFCVIRPVVSSSFQQSDKELLVQSAACVERPLIKNYFSIKTIVWPVVVVFFCIILSGFKCIH